MVALERDWALLGPGGRGQGTVVRALSPSGPPGMDAHSGHMTPSLS